MKIDYSDSLDERMDIARRILRHDNPADFFERAARMDNFNVGLLYGYVRSFVKLAYLGDVQKVARHLGITRQSISNHIVELENLLDARLFDKVGASSQLTSKGVLWLPRAQELFELGSVFLSRRTANDAQYQSTQLPFRMLMQDSSNSNLLRDFANAWLGSGQTLECPGIANFLDCGVVYERRNGAWVSRQIGPKSAYYGWFGADISQASTGQALGMMATGDDLQDEIAFLLDGVYTRGGIHFSEVACNLCRPGMTERSPVFYQRLLAECTHKEKKPVVVSMIEIIDPLQRGLAHG